jgi:RimJ/RimL family protein N-acetyltransferase
VRCYVEPSPAGGYHVKVRGSHAPVSRHDTEEEAEAAAAVYQQGLERAATGAEYVTLKDGSEVIVRQVRPEDKPLFVAGWERFGEESRYKRFMGHKRRLTMDELVRFTELDHVDHEAVGALDSRAREGLGVARYLRLPKRPDVAEVAIAVIDAWQGRGLGRVLLRRLTARAAENRIHKFTASLFTDNRAMLALFQRLGEVRVIGGEGRVLDVDVELPVADAANLAIALRTAATGHVGRRPIKPV